MCVRRARPGRHDIFKRSRLKKLVRRGRCGARGPGPVRRRAAGRTARRHQTTRRRSGPLRTHPSPALHTWTCGDARVDVAIAAAKDAKAAAKVAKVVKVVKVAEELEVVQPRRGIGPSTARSDRSRHRGRPSADLARAARAVAGELRWRRARLRRGVRGPGRLSPQRQRRQKCACEAGEAGRAARAGVRSSAWRVGGRVSRARAGRPAASEARLVDP